MGIERKLRRKAEREKAKKERQANIANKTAPQISQETGVSLETIYTWLETMAQKMEVEMSGNMAKLLWEGEEYMAAVNMVIMLHAVLMTFGDLKTVKKGMARLVRNVNPAIDKVDEMGTKKAFEALHEYGVDFEMEGFDINSLFDDPGKTKNILQRMRLEWRNP